MSGNMQVKMQKIVLNQITNATCLKNIFKLASRLSKAITHLPYTEFYVKEELSVASFYQICVK